MVVLAGEGEKRLTLPDNALVQLMQAKEVLAQFWALVFRVRHGDSRQNSSHIHFSFLQPPALHEGQQNMPTYANRCVKLHAVHCTVFLVQVLVSIANFDSMTG